MDVELQILKHLKRDARPTVSIIDQYCSAYNDLFSDVRSYECFKYLHQGIVSPIKRKSLPEIAKVVGVSSPQSLHHFLANSPWSEEELRTRRLNLTHKALKDQPITLIIDETGDRKKGKKTDYVARQYLGSVGKIDNGIVTVNAYGVYKNITFPLMFKVFKPKGTLKESDTYKTKIELASSIVTELIEFGFNIDLVLADSLYGEASSFIRTLDQHNLPWVFLKDTASHIAIRSNHGVWLSPQQRVRANKWCKFKRTFSDQKSEIRYIREIIYGKRNYRTYWEITTDTETMPENSTSFVMTNIQSSRNKMKKILGNLYGLRTWVKDGFRQCKQELGWTDYRFTNFKEINRWWEIIFSAYWMVSCSSKVFCELNQSQTLSTSKIQDQKFIPNFNLHQQWSNQEGWKTTLNNLRLVIQPTIIFWMIIPWLDFFPNRSLLVGFHRLLAIMNQFYFSFPDG
ncbi:IS701 family transposase [Hyella patelloides]|nr:IS701 family transposase [Hyella patelloides]